MGRMAGSRAVYVSSIIYYAIYCLQHLLLRYRHKRARLREGATVLAWPGVPNKLAPGVAASSPLSRCCVDLPMTMSDSSSSGGPRSPINAATATHAWLTASLISTRMPW